MVNSWIIKLFLYQFHDTEARQTDFRSVQATSCTKDTIWKCTMHQTQLCCSENTHHEYSTKISLSILRHSSRLSNGLDVRPTRQVTLRHTQDRTPQTYFRVSLERQYAITHKSKLSLTENTLETLHMSHWATSHDITLSELRPLHNPELHVKLYLRN